MHLGRLVWSLAPSHQHHAVALASVTSIAGTPMGADGHCVARDLADAMRWWQLAGAQGHPVACYVIGYYLQSGGAGFAVDRTEAFRWYQRAAAAGHHLAASQLQRLGS